MISWRQWVSAMSMTKALASGAILLSLLTVAFPVRAQVPELLEVPLQLGEPGRSALQKERHELQGRLAKLRSEGQVFNTNCASVRRGSAEDARCAAHHAELERMRRAYTTEAADFNRRVRGTPEPTIRAQTRAECISAAGHQLKADLEKCRSPIVECLRSAGVRSHEAICAASALVVALEPSKVTVLGAVIACGDKLYDAADVCGRTWGQCQTAPLRTHQMAIKKCPG